MGFIQFDDYDSGVSGEDGLDTRERQIEREQFGDVEFTDGTTGTISPDGILCPDEVVDVQVNKMLGGLRI
jgi:hypothetical protein